MIRAIMSAFVWHHKSSQNGFDMEFKLINLFSLHWNNIYANTFQMNYIILNGKERWKRLQLNNIDTFENVVKSFYFL